MNRLFFFLILILLSFIPVILAAQWTPQQCKDFVVIYLETEKQVGHPEVRMKRLMDRYKVSNSQFREMIDPETGSAQKRHLYLNEIQFVAALKEEAAEWRSLKEAEIIEACKDHMLSYPEYVEIRSRYRNNIAFQRSLKPYFDDYIKSLK